MTFEEIVEALPPFITEVDPDWFLENVFPPLSQPHLEEILSKLQNGFTTTLTNSSASSKTRNLKTYPPAIVRGRWRLYPRNPAKMPIKAGTHAATDAFKHLDELLDTIKTVAEYVVGKKRSGLTQQFKDSGAGSLWDVQQGEYVGPDSVAQWCMTRSEGVEDVKQVRQCL